MDEAGRTTQSPLIMAPPDPKADADEATGDTVVDTGIMTPSRAKGGNSRSVAAQRANGINRGDGSRDAVGNSSASSAAVTEELPVANGTVESGRSTAVPLPADTIGAAKVRPASGEVTDKKQDSGRQGSLHTMTSGESGDPADSAGSAQDTAPAAKPAFTPQETTTGQVSSSAPPQPGRSASTRYAHSEWSTEPGAGTTTATSSPGPAPDTEPVGPVPHYEYQPGNGFSSGAAGTGSAAASAADGFGSGAASAAGSAWQKPRGFQVRKQSRRQAMLTLSRVEPWSVMKFSFVASLVAFVILFVAIAVLYMVLAALGVFDSLQHTVSSVTSSQSASGTNLAHWFSASLILGYTAMLGALNIVLITAISTVGSVIYNLIAKTVGGIEVTLRETD